MKKAIVILLMLAGTVQAADMWQAAWARRAAVLAGYTPPGWANSVLWWKFNDATTNNVPDYSAAGNNYGVVVGTQKQWSDGKWSLTNAPYIRCVTTNLLNGQKGTIAIWAKIRDPEAFDPIVFSRVFSTGNNGIRLNSLYGVTNFDLTVYIANNAWTTTSKFTTNTWYRFALSVGASQAILYVNGVSNSAGSAANFVITEPWAVSRDTYGGRYGNGEYDDFLILTNYAWSASEALTDYNAGRTPAP